jgi:hypothetical protein
LAFLTETIAENTPLGTLLEITFDVLIPFAAVLGDVLSWLGPISTKLESDHEFQLNELMVAVTVSPLLKAAGGEGPKRHV